MEAEYLVSMFMEFWVGQVKAAYHPAAEGNGPTSSKGSAASSADSSAGAVKLLSGAEAVDAALDGNHNAGEPLELSHQGNDMEPGAAADIVDTTSGEELATKGSCSSALNVLKGAHMHQGLQSGPGLAILHVRSLLFVMIGSLMMLWLAMQQMKLSQDRVDKELQSLRMA